MTLKFVPFADGAPIEPVTDAIDVARPGYGLASTDPDIAPAIAAYSPSLATLLGEAQPTRQDALDRLKLELASQAGVMRFDPGTGVAVTVQTDPVSRTNLTGAMLLAQMDPSFTDNWTLADNSKLPVDSAGMIALAIAAGQHIKACHDRYDTLRETINAATDDAAAWAIDITTGWPA